jgi:hypothetical protein
MLQITNKSNQVSLAEDPAGGAVAAGALLSAVDTFTRPNDANPYAALDNVADSVAAPTILNFPNLARVNGGSGYIVKAYLITDQETNIVRYRLHLFTTAVAAQGDNTPHTLLYASRASYVGYLDSYQMDDEGAGSTGSQFLLSSGDGNLPLAFICAAGDRDLYGLLETLDVFTPDALQNYYIKLVSEAN